LIVDVITVLTVNSGLSALGRFCCRSQLRQSLNRDSVVVTRFSVGSFHGAAAQSELAILGGLEELVEIALEEGRLVQST
jgi:hypothetical protein